MSVVKEVPDRLSNGAIGTQKVLLAHLGMHQLPL